LFEPRRDFNRHLFQILEFRRSERGLLDGLNAIVSIRRVRTKSYDSLSVAPPISASCVCAATTFRHAAAGAFIVARRLRGETEESLYE
jgi:hypothetical protein